jgi:cysteine synthase B
MTRNLDIASEALAQTAKLIGNTPLLRIACLSSSKVNVYAKAEWSQLGNSIKARAAFRIISKAMQQGLLQDRVLLDASSGNTAIAYASICARVGIKLEICLPANASQKRKDILKALGTTLHLSSELEGTDGAQELARQLFASNPSKYFLADQYNNAANWQAHYYGTAEEIYAQSAAQVTHFIAGLGTTGSFVGNAKRLKEIDPSIKTIALQPNSPMHILEGWKHLETAVVPGIFSEENLDAYKAVDSLDALEMIQYIAKHEGILISPSSAANLVGARDLAAEIEEGYIVTLLPDDASKYDEVLNMIAL